MDKVKSQVLLKQFEECSFQPQINKSSSKVSKQDLNLTYKFDQLHQNSTAKPRKKQCVANEDQ